MIRLRSSDPLGVDLPHLLRLLGGAAPVVPPVVASPADPPPANPPPPPPPPPPPVVVVPPVNGAAMIPYVLFQGDPGNGPAFVTQARTDIMAADISGPFFVTGFFLARDSWFGMLCAVGAQDNPDAGLISLTLQGTMVRLFQWWFPAPGGWAVLADADGTIKPNQWQHVCATISSTTSRDLVVDGFRATPEVVTAIVPQGPLALTFGSYKTVTPGAQNIERHNFNGGLRDWALVHGTPTDAGIARHAGGESAVSIWGSRVWDAWSFTHDPRVAAEPGVNGHNLTWIDGGSAVGHHLPTLITS